MKNFYVEGATLIGDDGTLLTNVHDPEKCAGETCVVHNPTKHYMSDWDLHWYSELGVFVRICEHGLGHPDPDQDAYIQRIGIPRHICCGCCYKAQYGGDSKPSFWKRLWEVIAG